MPRVVRLALVLSLATAVHASAEVNLQQRGGRVDLTVTRAPVADVLDRLARQTGMKVMYEGPPPRQLLTMAVRDRTPAEAVLAVLEGLGLNYALISDPTGTRVEALMVAIRTATASAQAAPAATPTAQLPNRFGEPNSHRPYTPPGGGAPVDIPPPDEANEDTDNSGAQSPEAINPPQGPMGQPPVNAAPQQPQQPYPMPVAPPQQFPVSPFAPQPPAPPTPAPNPAQPGQNPGTAPQGTQQQ